MLPHKSKGFSFVELNIAISLFLIAAVAAIGVLSYCTLGAKKTMELSQSAHLAQSKMAELMYMNAGQITEVTTPRAFPSPFNKYFYTAIKSNTTDPRLSGLRELKITITGSTGAQTTLVKLIRGATTWAKTYNSRYNYGEILWGVILTDDGGFLLTGRISYGYNMLILKCAPNGDIQWHKVYRQRNGNPEYLNYGGYIEFQRTFDGNYIVGGELEQYAWLIKINSDGNIALLPNGANCEKFYGIEGILPSLESVRQTSDGGYITSMRFYYNDTRPRGSDYAVILKLNQNLEIQWQKVYGQLSGYNNINCIQQTADGGYIASGRAGRFTAYGAQTAVPWILKLDSNGDELWQKTYDPIYWAKLNYIQQTSDGGYIAGGLFNFMGNNNSWKTGLIFKLDVNGDIQWYKCFTPDVVTRWNIFDDLKKIQQTSDGGYIASIDCSVRVGNATYNTGLYKFDSRGQLQWGKLYKAPTGLFDGLMKQASGGEYVLGATVYVAGDQFSRYDFGLYKLDSGGNCSPLSADNSNIILHNISFSPYSQVPLYQGTLGPTPVRTYSPGWRTYAATLPFSITATQIAP